MSEPGGILDAQLEALLGLVARHRDARCETLRTEAQAQRHTLLRTAYREGRGRLGQAVATERRRLREQVEATRAQLQTAARQREHHGALLRLHRGWDRLPAALLERWHAPPSRRAWVEGSVVRALATLPPRRWRIDHPAGWEPAEFTPHLASVTTHCGAEPEFSMDPDIGAGLRLCADGACLDTTPAGLLADRTAIEARLLALLDRLGAERNPEVGDG